jgi:gliding motility-associated-like protein
MTNFFKKLGLLFLVLLMGCISFSQNISNKGKDFWVGYGFHQFMDPAGGANTQNMTLYISVENLPAGVPYATVTITIDSSGAIPSLWWKRVYRINANTVLSLDNSTTPAFSFAPASALSYGPLPKGTQDAGPSHTAGGFDARLYTDPCPAGTGGFGLFRKKGIHITSDVDIVAYAHIYGSVSSGATMLLPTNSWGYSYTTINSAQGDAAAAYNFFYVVAKDDSTRIKITGSAAPRSTPACTFTPPAAGTSFYVNLNKGQIFQYVGQADAAGNGVELTSSRIQSVPNANGKCKQIAVFAGSGRTSGETLGGCTASSRDNDMQQCFPEHTWGKTYATIPFSDGNSATSFSASTFQGSVYKIVSKDTGTIAVVNGVPHAIPLGGVYKFANSTPNYIEANKQIMVAQFMTSGNCGGGLGDPEMIYLSPLEQAIPQVGFYRNTKEAIDVNYVSIVIPDSGINKLRIDGVLTNVTNTTNGVFVAPHPRLPGYKMVIKGWAAAKSQCLISSNARFNAVTYGLGGAESYGYSSGAYFNDVSAKPTVFNNNDTTKNADSVNTHAHNYAYYSNQVSSPVQLRFLTSKHPKIITWNFSKTFDLAKVTVVNKRDSGINKDLIDYHPKAIDSSLIAGVWTDFKYQCPDTMLLYLTAFNPNQAPFKIDTFYVPITLHEIDSVKLYTTTVGTCNGSFGTLGDTIVLPYNVTYGGGVKIVANVPPCLTVPANFNAPDSVNYGVTREKIVSWFWEFENGTTSTLQNPIHQLTQPLNLVYLTVVTASGLKVITSTIASASTTIKYAAPDKVCVNQPVTLIDSTIWINKDSCIWNFGDGTRILDLSCNPVTHTYTTAGTYTIWHKLSLGGSTCILDSVPKIIVVSSKRYPVIDYINPCLDTTSIAKFNANLGVGGVAIKNYLWNFGQPSSGSFDSSKINPTLHNYSNEGDFTVKLNVVDSLGCLGDTIQTFAIKIKPHIYFNTIPTQICMNAGTVSYATYAGCYNQAKTLGKGIFKGQGIDTLGNFDPKIAGVGSKIIWYVYNSSKGCTDSISQQIIVKDTPVVDFDYPKACLPKTGVASFSNLTNLGFSFLWNFDDAANSSASNPNVDAGVNPSHTYANTGLHNVKLYAETVDGCKDSLTKAITFSVMPNIQFNALPSVCENEINVQVNKANVVNGVSGTGIYNGYGTTIAGILSPAVSGWGTQMITYTYTTTGGCIDSATQPILVKARPRLGFTYPAGCLPANGIVQFTDTSKLPDGQTIKNCFWTFGDANATATNPNTSNICSPSHTYNYGTYTIYHSDSSSLGCATDTTFQATFNIAPSLGYGAIPSVCENLTTHNVKFGIINNPAAAPGFGVYHGVGMIDEVNGIFNPSITGAGIHTIYYVYSATSGCTDSFPQTVNVLPKPHGLATFSPSTCLNTNGKVQFDASGITISAGGTISSYNWKFEGINSTIDTGTTPTHNYKDGTDTIYLNVPATNGCILDTSFVATFSVTPLLAPLVQIPNTCENGVIIRIDSAKILNGVVGSGVFSSSRNPNSFVNKITGDYDPSVAGWGNDTVYYTFTGASTLGCQTTQILIININAKPTGSFSYLPVTGCLDANGKVDFNATNVATADASPITTYDWLFENGSVAGTGVSPTHNYNDAVYTISLKATAANGCIADIPAITDTFYKTPVIAPITHVAVCENELNVKIDTAVITNGAIGTGVFSSVKNAFTNTTTGAYDPSKAGVGWDTIYYKLNSSNGVCFAIDTLYLYVNAKPAGSFTYTPITGCLDANGKVDFDATGVATADASPIATYNWLFENGAVPGVGKKPSHNYADGIYTISLSATAANGCTAVIPPMTDTFHRKPVLASFIQNEVCENGGIFTFVAPSILNGVFLGNGVFTSSKNAFTNTVSGNYDPSIAGAGVDVITYKFTTDGGCDDTKTFNLIINPKPTGTLAISPSSGCLDVTGLVQFNASGITAGGVTIPNNNWQWQFEGAGAAPVAAGKNPIHNYNDGTYDIIVGATSAKNCFNSFTVTKTFNRTPSLGPIVFNNICANSTSFTLTPPAVLNSVIKQKDEFSSYFNAVIGDIYDPAVAIYNYDTIYYTFTALSGCSTSVKKAVQVYPVPQPVIDVKSDVCLDSLITFKDNSQITGGSIKDRVWIFEQDTIRNPNNNTITRGFNSIKTYTVILSDTSSKGCYANDTATFTVRSKPRAKFTVNSVVCMPFGVATFTTSDSTFVAANGGTLKYDWTFGDAANATPFNQNTSILPNPTHTFNATNIYPIKLVVTSIPYNCQDYYYDTLRPGKPLVNRPTVSFTIEKDTVCENEPIVLNATSNGIFSWTWNYGDGTVPNTAQTPISSYTYQYPGPFTIKLTARDSVLCQSLPDEHSVIVYPQPKIDSMPEIVVLKNTFVPFKPKVNDTAGVQFWWSALYPPFTVNDLTNPNILNPYLTAIQTQVYVLHALGNNGCSDFKYQSVKVLGTISIPNAFSPNGDGKNDTWKITSLGDYPAPKLDIFDRSGSKIKSFNGGSIEWDGTRNGTPVPLGVYYYIIDPGMGLQKITGWVMVIR